VKRSRFLTSAALALTALFAGCGDGTAPPAAVVDGVTISQQDLVDELEAIEANTGYLEAYEAAAEAQGGPAILGTADGEFNRDFVTSSLALRIQYALVESEVDSRGLDVDGRCREVAREQVVSRFAGASTAGDGEAVLAAFGDEYAGYLLDREADFFALQADLSGLECGAGPSDEAVEAYFEEHRDEFAVETACASHILVATVEEAEEVRGLLEGGGDFAALAAERSTDPGSAAQGGALGCAPAGQYVPEFDAAVFGQAVGEVGEPVATDFGFHLILVTEREISTPTLDDVRPQIEAALQEAAQGAFFEWFDEALANGDVEVDPRYGTWDPTTATIVPPDSVESTGELIDE